MSNQDAVGRDRPGTSGGIYDADTWSSLALREHLLAQVHNNPHPHKIESLQTSSSASPHDHNIDPAIAGTGMLNTSAGESGGDDNGSDGKKGGKRELSTSKRAAQNRAAQVWFLILIFHYG